MEGKTQQAAAASAAMSERSARKWQHGSLPSERKTDGVGGPDRTHLRMCGRGMWSHCCGPIPMVS